ncbi:uncharacterized protein LOC132890123 [Neoarius graeffei]|uniref:uncharacterized protein LOC132890123 n=1 Tax=Neoarius graeffei TaxID=443677 RepID=UPI00298CEE20|nr:uncharacterized protein LOC132890123 [Neoarius graeffei]
MGENRESPTEDAVENAEQPTEDAMVENVERLTEDATVENREQPCPDFVIPEHFGAFDNSVSLYSGFDNSTLTSPRHPTMSQTCDCTMLTTLNIPDVPSEPADGPSASHQSEDDSCQDSLTKQATAIVLTARERHHLSQTGVNEVVAAMQQYQALLVTNLRSRLQRVFQQHQGSELEKEALAVFDQLEDPFASVSTTYRQDCVIKDYFHFVESEEVTVGYTACFLKKGAKRVLPTRPKCFQW